MTTSTDPKLAIDSYLGKNVPLLPQAHQLRALHTIIRDRPARRDDFVAHSERIIRRLIELGLDLLPLEGWKVEAPVGQSYDGLRLTQSICGVSVARAGGRYSQLRIATSAIDARLNEDAYTVPGIGDFGDRHFGTDA